MNLEEYESFMQSLSEYASSIGLEANNLYKDTYEPFNIDKWVISVSWKTELDSWYVLCSENDDKTLIRTLNYPIVVGTKAEIESYLRKAEDADAECFLKQCISWSGFIQPSPHFMGLSKVEQAEYTFHEAYHSAKKCFFEKEVEHLPSGSEEEACAFVAGYLSAINYFKGSELEEEAIKHFQNHLTLANKIVQFYDELYAVYLFRVGEDKRPIPLEQDMKDREKVFAKAKSVFGGRLGEPINNAFFIYWHYFYRDVPRVYKKVEGSQDICEIVKTLRGL